MPSMAHEVLLQALREPGVLAELVSRARNVKAGPLAPSDPNLSETKPVEWHGDALFLSGEKEPARWLMLEVQTSVDREKLRTIPLSFELARERYRSADGDVVLVTAGARVARWFARHPFRYRGPLGTTRALSVVLVNLTRLPVGKLLDERYPALALLAVAAHAKGPREKARRVATQALALAHEWGPAASAVVDGILQLVDAGLRRKLEEAMERHKGYRTDWLQDAYSKGEAKGKDEGRSEEARAALLRVLSKRGFTPTCEQQARIDAEGDLVLLERWHDAAIDASSVAEIFSDA